jgi:hypothetical protein
MMRLLQAATQETLKRLSADTLTAVLRSDNLRVPSEMCVFHSVVQWLEADPARISLAADVLGHVRFPTMTQQELCKVADHPLLVADHRVQVRGDPPPPPGGAAAMLGLPNTSSFLLPLLHQRSTSPSLDCGFLLAEEGCDVSAG